MTQRPSAPTARITTVTLGKMKEQVPTCFYCSCLHLGGVSVIFCMHVPFFLGGPAAMIELLGTVAVAQLWRNF